MKGCKKNVVMIKGGADDLFEDAYFIMRDTAKEHTARDIVEEAKRIIAENELKTTMYYVKDRTKAKIVIFLYGLIFGLVLETALFILL